MGQELATVIRAHGPEGWNALRTRAVAQIDPAPPAAAASGGAKVQKVQFAVPVGPLPLPLPPVIVPGTRENRAMGKPTSTTH